jgi:hypothetical protein
MLLIYGELMRSIWLLIGSAAMMRYDPDGKGSPFCQCTGFLIHYGTLTSGMCFTVMFTVFPNESRLRCSCHLRTQRAPSFSTCHVSHLRRPVSVSPLRVRWQPVGPEFHVQPGVHQFTRGLPGSRRVLHPSTSTVLVSFGIGVGTTLLDRDDHCHPCYCHICVCWLRVS